MTQTRSRVGLEFFAVIGTLALGGMLLYALLPFLTAPDQQVVPPPPQMDLGQTLLTLFIAATAIGAPLTAGIVLALVFKFASKRVAATSSAAPEIPTPKAKPRAVDQPKDERPADGRRGVSCKLRCPAVCTPPVGGGLHSDLPNQQNVTAMPAPGKWAPEFG